MGQAALTAKRAAVQVDAVAQKERDLERFDELNTWAQEMCEKYKPYSRGCGIGHFRNTLSAEFTFVYARKEDKDIIILNPPFPVPVYVNWIRKNMPTDEHYEVVIDDLPVSLQGFPFWSVPDSQELGFQLKPRLLGIGWALVIHRSTDETHTVEGSTLTFNIPYCPGAMSCANPVWGYEVDLPLLTKTVAVNVHYIDRSGIK